MRLLLAEFPVREGREVELRFFDRLHEWYVPLKPGAEELLVEVDVVASDLSREHFLGRRLSGEEHRLVLRDRRHPQIEMLRHKLIEHIRLHLHRLELAEGEPRLR